MNPGQLGLNRRSAYSRAQRRRILHTIAGLVCLLVVWLAYGVMPHSAAGGSSKEPKAAEATVSPVTTRLVTPTPRKSAAASASYALLAPLPAIADAPPPVTFNAQGGQTELATSSAALDDSTLPEQSTHVPFLRSLMAAVDPGAARFGYGHGAGGFAGGGFGGGGFGGGSGGAVPGQADSTLASEFGDTGSQRAHLLGDHLHDEALIGNATDGGANNGGGGSNGGGSGGNSSNNDESKNSGSNNGSNGNGGSNGGGSNNGGSTDGGSNNGGSSDEVSSLSEDGPSGGSHDETEPGDNSGEQPNGTQAASFVAALDVPEPGLMLLTGVGIAAAVVRRRARRG